LPVSSTGFFSAAEIYVGYRYFPAVQPLSIMSVLPVTIAASSLAR
jgi:hypothetical protein